MHSITVPSIQDLVFVIMLFVILCYVIRMYRTLMNWEARVDHQQPVRARGRNYRREINAERNHYNHRDNRYPTEHDERHG